MDPWGRAAGNLAVRLDVTGRAAVADSRFALIPLNRRGGTSFNVTFNVRIPKGFLRSTFKFRGGLNN